MKVATTARPLKKIVFQLVIIASKVLVVFFARALDIKMQQFKYLLVSIIIHPLYKPTLQFTDVLIALSRVH